MINKWLHVIPDINVNAYKIASDIKQKMIEEHLSYGTNPLEVFVRESFKLTDEERLLVASLCLKTLMRSNGRTNKPIRRENKD